MEELTDHYEDVNIRAICSDEPDRIGPPKQVGLDGQYRAGDLCEPQGVSNPDPSPTEPKL